VAVTRYDTGTRIWTAVLGVLLAAVIDWISVVNPARDFHPHAPHTGWWLFGLIIVCVPPAAWLVGRLTERHYSHAVVWAVVLWAVVLFHFIPLTWAQGRT
jgi:hypothetical protein